MPPGPRQTHRRRGPSDRASPGGLGQPGWRPGAPGNISAVRASLSIVAGRRSADAPRRASLRSGPDYGKPGNKRTDPRHLGRSRDRRERHHSIAGKTRCMRPQLHGHPVSFAACAFQFAADATRGQQRHLAEGAGAGLLEIQPQAALNPSAVSERKRGARAPLAAKTPTRKVDYPPRPDYNGFALVMGRRAAR